MNGPPRLEVFLCPYCASPMNREDPRCWVCYERQPAGTQVTAWPSSEQAEPADRAGQKAIDSVRAQPGMPGAAMDPSSEGQSVQREMPYAPAPWSPSPGTVQQGPTDFTLLVGLVIVSIGLTLMVMFGMGSVGDFGGIVMLLPAVLPALIVTAIRVQSQQAVGRKIDAPSVLLTFVTTLAVSFAVTVATTFILAIALFIALFIMCWSLCASFSGGY
jgi:hypothetical protein